MILGRATTNLKIRKITPPSWNGCGKRENKITHGDNHAWTELNIFKIN
jgi:hypothetical protein